MTITSTHIQEQPRKCSRFYKLCEYFLNDSFTCRVDGYACSSSERPSARFLTKCAEPLVIDFKTARETRDKRESARQYEKISHLADHLVPYE